MGRGRQAIGSATWIAMLSAMVFLLSIGLYSRVLQLQGGNGSASPTTFVNLLLGGLALAAVVASLAPWRGLRLALLSASSVAGLVLGVLAVFSVGLLVLVGAFLAAGAYFLNLTERTARPQWRRAGLTSIAGGLAGLVAVGVVFVPSMFPRVDCQPGGASFTGGWGFFGGNSSGGTMSVSADGRNISGTGSGGGHTYHFSCHDGKLVEFTQRG